VRLRGNFRVVVDDEDDLGRGVRLSANRLDRSDQIVPALARGGADDD
jgi:hypothetical protein